MSEILKHSVSKPLIILGGGGHAKSCLDVILRCPDISIKGILDSRIPKGQTVMGVPVLGTDDDLPEYLGRGFTFFIGIGQIKSPKRRMELFAFLKEKGEQLPPILSPEATVSSFAFIDEGSIVMHHAVINSEAKIGKNGIINTGAIIEHDVVIGNDVHISTGAIINGECRIGDRCFIGSRAVLNHGVVVASDSILGAGTVVTQSLTEAGTYVGCPARKVS